MADMYGFMIYNPTRKKPNAFQSPIEIWGKLG